MLQRLRNIIKSEIQNAVVPIILDVSKTSVSKLEFLNSQLSQKQLLIQYQLVKKLKLPLPDFNDTGFRLFSQTDEDGLLLYIFSLIGFKSKQLIDIAFGSPYEANTTNLLCNWGFYGLLIEGGNFDKAKQFFKTHKDTHIFPPCLINKWVTAENINSICTENGFSGEIDLLSLDIDGVDYWLWKSLTVVEPRVVVLEYQDILGPKDAVTVPYDPEFDRFKIHPDFCGASLAAFTKLASEKGYRLVGTNRYGYNAFYIKNGIGEDYFPEIQVTDCFSHPKVKSGMDTRYPEIKDLPWQKI